MAKKVLLTVLLLVPLSVFGADSNYGDLTVTRLIRVYDGDTFYVDIDELHPIIGKTHRFV